MTEKVESMAGLDITDEHAVTRVSLTTGESLGGRRVAPAAGLIVRDSAGNERGGIGVLDLPEGARVMSILDHRGGDGIGMVVSDDGSAGLFINDAPGVDRSPQATRLRAEIAADGTPGITLADAAGRTRLRFGLTDGGAGAIEFFDANGDCVQRLIPEEDH